MFAKRDVILMQEYLGFLLLSLFDLFLTGWIFKHEGQEANGIAAWVLVHWKLAGFVLFKFGMVSFVIIVCEIIAMHSLPRARMLILGACALLMCVVLWECYLIWMFIDRPQIHPAPNAYSQLNHERPVRLRLSNA